MKQMVESKLLIGFVVMVLGMTYVNTTSVTKLENTKADSDYSNVIAMNVD